MQILLSSDRFVLGDKMRKCGYLIPSFAMFLSRKDKDGCLLPIGHIGYHLNESKEGGYISWGGCSCDEYCNFCGDCFYSSEITETEARTIINDPSKNNDD